jgi:hypothetical protein
VDQLLWKKSAGGRAAALNIDVRSSPNSGLSPWRDLGPLCATSGSHLDWKTDVETARCAKQPLVPRLVPIPGMLMSENTKAGACSVALASATPALRWWWSL